MASIAEKDEELQTLRSCLSQVTEQAAADNGGSGANEGTDGGAPSEEGENEGGEAVDVNEKEKKQSRLEKIQAMLDTTKVHSTHVHV